MSLAPVEPGGCMSDFVAVGLVVLFFLISLALTAWGEKSR
jgi:hypothetical protein